MKKTVLTSLTVLCMVALMAFTNEPAKLVSRTGHISFFSHTTFEDITADNFSVVSTIEPATGNVVFSASMQAFEFENSLMQKHFNSKGFLDTKQYSKAKLKGTITNLPDIDFNTDGIYNALIEGTLEMHGVTNKVVEKGVITVNGSKVTVEAKLKIHLADYNITFDKGKPSTNVAKTVDVTMKIIYE